MKVETKTAKEINNLETAIPIDKIKSIKLDKNKKYVIQVRVESPLVKEPIIKKTKAILMQETDSFFAFKIKTKSGTYKTEIINKFDYLKKPNLIEVVA